MLRVGGLPEPRAEMRAQDRTRQRISLGDLMTGSVDVASVSTLRRSRSDSYPRRETWSRMSPLERALAADRDDPSFDYAAN
jgi:hypothetical protein